MGRKNIFASVLETVESLSEEAREIRKIDMEIGREVSESGKADESDSRDRKIDDAIEEFDGVIREVPDVKEDQKKDFNKKILDLIDKF